MGMSLPQPSLHCVAGGQNKQPSGLEVEKPFGRNRRELESSGSAVKDSNLFRSSYHQWPICAGTRENRVKLSV